MNDTALDTHDRDAPIFAPDAFRLADEEAALIEKARRFGARVLAPRAAQHDRDATFPIENFRDMHPEGLLRICVPQKHGGLGASFRTYCLAAAELGRYCGATALSWNMPVCSALWARAPPPRRPPATPPPPPPPPEPCTCARPCGPARSPTIST